MAEDLENDKWVEARLSLSSHSTGIIKSKKELTAYAEELGWEVDVDKKGYVDKDGDKMFEITVVPKGKKCSPEELREKRELLEGFAISVMRDIIYATRPDQLPERAVIRYTPYKNEDKKDMLNIVFAEVFIIDIDLKKGIKLEIEKRNLFKKAFGISLIEWYEESLDKLDKIFIGEEDKAQAQAIMKLMEDNGMPKITPKKKSFLKKVFG